MNLKIIEDRLVREHSLPADWHWSKWRAVGPVGDVWGHEFTGCRCPLVTRGPRKGKPNWTKATDQRTYQVSTAVVQQWTADYERETGLCSTCRGAKQEFASWSKDGGTKYRTCTSCKGTGRAG